MWGRKKFGKNSWKTSNGSPERSRYQETHSTICPQTSTNCRNIFRSIESGEKKENEVEKQKFSNMYFKILLKLIEIKFLVFKTFLRLSKMNSIPATINFLNSILLKLEILVKQFSQFCWTFRLMLDTQISEELVRFPGIQFVSS